MTASAVPGTDDPLVREAESALAAGWPDPPARLRAALEDDELALWCQPVASLAAEARFPLAEVLVRLREEEAMLLPPGEFLPVFGHYGMLPDLDRWVIRRAVEWLAGPGARAGRALSVNISTPTLAEPLAPLLTPLLAATGVPAASLVFEIDEGDVLDHAAPAAGFAAEARALGCGVLIDGFARRAVSFAPFRALGIGWVKVDGTIVRRMGASPLAEQKLCAILRVGKSMGVHVIAECVEDDAVLARLRQIGVGYAQGFGIAEPRPL